MIYILEDDDSIRKLVIYALESQRFQACGFDSCKHEPGVLLETRYHHNAVGHGHVPYERTRTYRCRKCGKEFTKKDHVSTPTL